MNPGQARSRTARAVAAIFGIDRRSLAAMRIGVGTLLLVDLVSRARHLGLFYTDAGLVPRELVDPWYREIFVSIHGLSGSTAWQVLVFALAGAFAVLLAAGWFTRLAAVASWVLLTTLQLRNPYVGDFGDEIFRLVLFWCMFLPLGSCWSIDARREGGPGSREPVLSVASAGILCQIVIVYFVGALHKSGADWHGDATAIYYTLHQDWMARRLGVFLRPFEAVGSFATRVVLAFEYVGAFLLLTPSRFGAIRTAAVVAFWLFHLSLAVSITLGVFPWIVGAALVAFLPGWFWDRVGLPLASAGEATSAVSTARRVAGGAANAFAALALVWVVAHNVGHLTGTSMPAALARWGDMLRLDQRWVMYSPDVPRTDGWYVTPGLLGDGSVVDLTPGGSALDLDSEAPVDWNKPDLLSSDHLSWRWGIYMIRLQEPGSRALLQRFASWTCRQWNARNDGPRRLEQLEIYFMNERTPRPGIVPEARPVKLVAGSCP
jgi:hypothetical protein